MPIHHNPWPCVQVTRDIPGIDAAFLAMDTDDGVEVVWNEVRYSNRKSGRKEMLVRILQRLTEFKHTNIVNFIHFWHDRVDNQDRVSSQINQLSPPITPPPTHTHVVVQFLFTISVCFDLSAISPNPCIAGVHHRVHDLWVTAPVPQESKTYKEECH